MAKLGEVCAFQSGGTPSKNKPEYFGGEIPWISTTALNGGKINEADAVAWITPKAIRESAAKIVPANSIMVGTRVGIGKVAINTVEMSTSQDVISLIGIDKDKWYKPYLCKLLLSKKDYFNSQARGATIKGIKIDVVANIDVPEIDYATQRKVAATLNKIETLIVLRKQQLAKLDELVKARFVEMFGDINVNNKKWMTYPLGELCTIVRGGSPRPIERYLGGTIPWIKIGDATTGENIYLNSTKEYIIQEGVKKSRMIKAGSLIFANCGVSLGFARIITFDGCIHDGWLAMEDIDEKLDKIFLLYSLNQMTEYFRKTAPAGTQPNLNTNIMKMHRQIVPPMEMQKAFISFVKCADRQKQTVQQSLEKLELMKNVLMQEYLG